MNDLIVVFSSETLQVVDVERFFGSEEGEVFYRSRCGQLLYHDEGHLAGLGIQFVKPLLKQAIANQIAK